ncbi:DUF7507 domain-containing protein, partial [Gangjinia marincola]|uniref:DUF7507 domain-containing protein n=1 Tax=Gangjinia marincola TaxID=578463 RepID=UPI003CD09C82
QSDINNGEVVNSATVTADGPNGLTATDVSDSLNPADDTGADDDPTVEPLQQVINVTLTKTGVIDDGGDGVIDAGDTVTYTFVVTNTGNVTITNFVLTDPLFDASGIVFDNTTLDPGETATGTLTDIYVLTQDNVDDGFVQNSATIEVDDTVIGLSTTDVSDAGDETVETPDGNGNTDGDPTNDPTVLDIPQTATIVLTKDSEFIDGNGNGIP